MNKGLIAVAISLAVPLTAMLAQETAASDPMATGAAPEPVAAEVAPAESMAAQPAAPEVTAPETSVAESDADAALPASETAAAPAAAEEDVQGTGVTGEKGKETLSVDFPNAEVRTILRNIADLFELNLVIPETLEGRASLKLRDVTWKQIFDVLLSPIGYTYVTDGNIIKVVSVESLNVEPAETRIFLLNYARAAEIAPTVASMIDQSKGGKLQIDQRTNALVITERPKRLEKIDEIIKRLDRGTAQVMIETKFVEVTNRDVKNIGINWASLNGYKLTAGPFSHQYDRTADRSRGLDSSRETGDLTNLGKVDLTGPTAKVNGEPGVVNGRLIDNATGATLLDMTSDSTTHVLTDAINNLTSLVNNDASSSVTSAMFSAPQFEMVLSALKTQNETRLVSNPTVVTLNNQEAVISIGEQFPIPAYTYNQERGTFEVSGFEYKDIGIILKVTPQVNNAGLITLKIDPEVSSRSGTTTFGGANSAEIPIIATRRTSTQVALRDGYTMGLGGLIENVRQDSESKVPVLGDIPVLGRLFRSNGKDDQRRNLIVFITAKILSPEGATYKDVFSPSMIEQMHLTEEDIPNRQGAE